MHAVVVINFRKLHIYHLLHQICFEVTVGESESTRKCLICQPAFLTASVWTSPFEIAFFYFQMCLDFTSFFFFLKLPFFAIHGQCFII